MLVTLDPGIRGCGLAIFSGGALFRATYVRNPTRAGCDGAAIAAMLGALKADIAPHVPRADRATVVVEMPQVYTAGKGKGDPNDLLPLAAIDGGLVSMHPWGKIITYKPRQWKGTIDPDILVARIAATGPGALLSIHEHTNTSPPCASLAHNMWDAVGIGLFYLGRLTQRLYPGASPG